MQQVVQQGTGSYARNLGRPAAGKTGTTNDNRSAWFAGFTPQLAASVALYQIGEDGSQQSLALGGGEVTGGSYPVRIWTAFMKAALQGQPRQSFPQPDYLGTTRGGSAATATPSRTRSPSSSASATSSPSETATASPTDTPTASATQSPTSSATDTPTGPSPAATATPSTAAADAARAEPSRSPEAESASAGPTG
jgi:membrane carboxypeptidase/penicillin-binding protein